MKLKNRDFQKLDSFENNIVEFLKENHGRKHEDAVRILMSIETFLTYYVMGQNLRITLPRYLTMQTK